MTNRRSTKQNANLASQNASANSDDRSMMDTGNQELVRRLDLLEQLLKDRVNSENVQIKQLQEKVQQLEDQVEQYKIHMKVLEDKVTRT